MRVEERRKALLAYLYTHGRATTEEMALLFPDVSAMTIRRDLEHLEKTGEVLRVYGGAVLNPSQFKEEALYGDREVRSRGAKEAIARRAMELIGDVRSLYVDAGTTCMEFARLLPEREFSVVTPGANIAAAIAARNARAAVTLLGGAVSPKSLAASGSEALAQLGRMNVDTAVMCASGYSAKTGFTNGHVGESELKRAVIAKARRVIMLLDSGKFGSTLTYTFAGPEDVDVLVCEKDPGEAAAGIDAAKLVFAQEA